MRRFHNHSTHCARGRLEPCNHKLDEGLNNSKGVTTSNTCYHRVLVCQLEISAETSLYALKMGGDNGAITILNPAPAVEKLNTGDFVGNGDSVLNQINSFT